jgi:serine/threonine-protein kinase
VSRRRSRLRRAAGALALVVAVAAIAWGVWEYVIPHTQPVPAVRGTPLDRAIERLTTLGFRVQVAEGVHDDTIAGGHVVAMDPPAGTELEEGATVTLVPSRGPPPVPVPNVVGEPLDAAVAAIRSAGLEPEVRRSYHDTVPEGDVISQSPERGKAPEGSALTITVSRGHAPVVVPKVVGSTQDDAERVLEDAGFRVIVRTAYSDDVDRGDVIRVEPGQGARIAYGSAVTLTVSQGPERFPAPDLRGLTPQEAEARGESLGLVVTFFYVPNTPQTVVISQSPEVGEIVTVGDTIQVFVA